MALSELSERCYRTIGHYLSTIGVHYRTIGPGLSPYLHMGEVVPWLPHSSSGYSERAFSLVGKSMF